LIEKLRQRCVTLVYISHVLDDVLRLCDAIVVLRDGQVVGSGGTSEFDHNRLVSLMVGRSITQMYPQRAVTPAREPILEVRGLSRIGSAANITFTLHKQEVLGVAGLMGAGRSELARMLFGLDATDSGEIRLLGRQLAPGSPHGRIEQGIAFLTENRREDGLCLDGSIAGNMALVAIRQFSGPLLRWVRVRELLNRLREMRARVGVTPSARDEQAVKTLSGGNQQKVVLAKWLLAGPRVFILDEPTRGIDVGARHQIYELINQLAVDGAGVLIISSELEELIGLCDRILVMRNGELAGEFARGQFDREQILRAALREGT
jgi:ribose transport system ATP-binding protein